MGEAVEEQLANPVTAPAAHDEHDVARAHLTGQP
jgi:hypothetical protein